MPSSNTVNSHSDLVDLKIVHINLAGRPSAAINLIPYLDQQDNYLISINEPPVNQFGVHSLNRFEKLIHSPDRENDTRCCVAAGGSLLQVCQLTQFINHYCVTCEVTFNELKFILISVYMPPSDDIETALSFLSEILLEFNDHPIIILSDTNARHKAWHQGDTNSRGDVLFDFILEHNLIVSNEDTTPTFYTIRDSVLFKSAIDLCICNQRAYRFVDKTFVDLDNPSLSDHRYLITHLNKTHTKRTITKTTRKFTTKDTDWLDFQKFFSQKASESLHLFDNCDSRSKINRAVDCLQNLVEQTCREKHRRYTKKSVRRVAWLDDEIQLARTKLCTLFKNYRGSSNDLIRAYNYECYLQARRDYKKLVASKKRQSWKAFCDQATSSNLYQVFSSTKTNSTLNAISTIEMQNGEFTTGLDDTARHLLNVHFPNKQHPPIHQPDRPLTRPELEEIERVTAEEIIKVLEDFNPNKSPGKDGVASDSLLNCVRACPRLFEGLFNDMLQVGYFPKHWKLGVVCMIPKTSSIVNAKSYRPITLLAIIGKCLERIINNRLIRYLHLNHLLDENQFGFTRQKSVEDALENLIDRVNEIIDRNKVALVVSFDIAGAFDNAPWYRIIDSLGEKHCPAYLINILRSYLSQRKVELIGTVGQTKELTQGCPQGSVLGPTLWNLLIDALLKLAAMSGVFRQAFADDFVIVIELDKFENLDDEVRSRVESLIKVVYDWGAENHLEFNAKKTQAMFVCRRTEIPTVKFEVNQQEIETSNQLRYLGVLLDSKLNFTAHITDRISRARQTLFMLRRICSKTWGLSPTLANHLYGSVIQTKVAFASEIWAHRCSLISVTKSLRRFQRQCAIVACKAYRTVRTETALMMQQLLPIDRFVLYKYMCRAVKRYKNLNDTPVETPVHWLSTIPPWR